MLIPEIEILEGSRAPNLSLGSRAGSVQGTGWIRSLLGYWMAINGCSSIFLRLLYGPRLFSFGRLITLMLTAQTQARGSLSAAGLCSGW